MGPDQQSTGMWKFASLHDFAKVLRWLHRRHRRGDTDEAILTYFRAAVPLLREGLDEYQAHTVAVDGLCEHLLSDPTRIRRLGFQPAYGMTLLDKLLRTGDDLRGYFDRIASLREEDFLAHWRRVLSSQSEYMYLLRRLVDDFGNFEQLLPALPGTGQRVIDPRVQEHIARMYQINMRNVRLFEMIRDQWRSWRENAPLPDTSFFEPRADIALEMGKMITEYLVQADPDRIRARRQAAEQRGRRFVPYRFWRAAENLRLMANVEYLDTLGRKPVMRRPYLDLQFQPTPPICMDIRRLSWTFKEILNNALSASSRMYVSAGGEWEADPLPRHATPEPNPAIRLETRPHRQGSFWRRRHKLRLTFVDEGGGIDPEHLPYVTYWAYSPRREEFHARARRAELSKDQASQEIQIGGKGIGLGYASAVVREHGGNLQITSPPGEGTTVTIDLPVPTSMKIRV